MKIIYRPILALLLAGSGVAAMFLGEGALGIAVGIITIGTAVRYFLSTPFHAS